MNYPRINDDWRNNPDSNGTCVLTSCTKCEVTEERNGRYELSLSYPVGAPHWLELDIGRTIFCKPNQYDQSQPFIIKKVSKPMVGQISVTAEHVSYDLNGIMVSGFNAGTSSAFRNAINSNAVYNPAGFSFQTSIMKQAAHAHLGLYNPPRTFRSLLLDEVDSFVSMFGGEIEFDRLSVIAHAARGADRGVTIRYGKNLLALTKTRTARDFATAVYPYYFKKKEDGIAQYVELPERFLHFGASEYSDIEKTIPLDLTSEFDEMPTQATLRDAATTWINENWQESPPDNLKISFVDLAKTSEYKDIAAVETVKLCDTITVVHPEMQLSRKAKVIKCVYDVLKDRLSSIEIGDPIPTFAETILKIAGGKK